MGLLFDFYAGDSALLGAAFTENDFPQLEKLARAHADFSLHLSPTDLDILSETAFRMTGLPPVALLDSLKANVGGDGSECGAHTLKEDWVACFASFSDDRVPELATRWFRAAADERGERAEEVPPDARHAVQQLVHLCRLATQESLDVVHTWSL